MGSRRSNPVPLNAVIEAGFGKIPSIQPKLPDVQKLIPNRKCQLSSSIAALGYESPSGPVELCVSSILNSGNQENEVGGHVKAQDAALIAAPLTARAARFPI